MKTDARVKDAIEYLRTARNHTERSIDELDDALRKICEKKQDATNRAVVLLGKEEYRDRYEQSAAEETHWEVIRNQIATARDMQEGSLKLIEEQLKKIRNQE